MNSCQLASTKKASIRFTYVYCTVYIHTRVNKEECLVKHAHPHAHSRTTSQLTRHTEGSPPGIHEPAAEDLPVMHEWHIDLSAPAENLPAAQFVQNNATGSGFALWRGGLKFAYLPAAHTMQSVGLLPMVPTGSALPCGQFTQ